MKDMKKTILLLLLLFPIQLFAFDTVSYALGSASSDMEDYYYSYRQDSIARQEAEKAQSMAVMGIDMNKQCKFCIANKDTACRSKALCDLCLACDGFSYSYMFPKGAFEYLAVLLIFMFGVGIISYYTKR